MAENEIDRLYLSPHPDDVAFSAPGAIRQHRAEGGEVVELVLFSRAGEEAADEVRESYEQRREEARRAAEIGGWEVRFAGVVDAPFRSHPHRDFNAIVWGESPDDEAIVGRLAERIEAAIAEIGASEVVGPLGVGRHIDHRLVHRATRAAADEPQVWWYEDRPYAVVPEAVNVRLAELGVDVELDLESFLDAFREAPYVDEHLTDPEAWEVCRGNYRRLAHRAARAEATRSAIGRRFEPDDLDPIWEVVFAHRSQIEAFLGGEHVFKRACRRYAGDVRPNATYLERQWTFS
ncbi:MAG: PIG-L deacetylase family protein [Bradymonadaceae bacterium]